MKMLCDYCDKRNKCTKIISNEHCSEFAHKLSFIEIDDSRDVYSLSNRVEWDYSKCDMYIIHFVSHYMIYSSNAFKIMMYDESGNKYIFDESEIKEMNWFSNKDEAEEVVNILNSCGG